MLSVVNPLSLPEGGLFLRITHGRRDIPLEFAWREDEGDQHPAEEEGSASNEEGGSKAGIAGEDEGGSTSEEEGEREGVACKPKRKLARLHQIVPAVRATLHRWDPSPQQKGLPRLSNKKRLGNELSRNLLCEQHDADGNLNLHCSDGLNLGEAIVLDVVYCPPLGSPAGTRGVELKVVSLRRQGFGFSFTQVADTR